MPDRWRVKVDRTSYWYNNAVIAEHPDGRKIDLENIENMLNGYDIMAHFHDNVADVLAHEPNPNTPLRSIQVAYFLSQSQLAALMRVPVEENEDG